MSKTYLSFSNINAYKVADNLSDQVWGIVSSWEWFGKSTLGIQYVKAVDSIAGNIAEGFGRFHKKDKEKFYYNARGSVYEALHWTEKAEKRALLSREDYENITKQLTTLPREINWLIKITEEKLSI